MRTLQERYRAGEAGCVWGTHRRGTGESWLRGDCPRALSCGDKATFNLILKNKCVWEPGSQFTEEQQVSGPWELSPPSLPSTIPAFCIPPSAPSQLCFPHSTLYPLTCYILYLFGYYLSTSSILRLNKNFMETITLVCLFCCHCLARYMCSVNIC